MRNLLFAASTLAVVAGASLSPAFALDPRVSGGQVWTNPEYYKQVTPYCGPYDKATRCFRSQSGQPPAAR